ncbi:MAG: DNA-binding protein [Actinomycetota bacterium]|nr:DNA-binding protein [Actinomycetota bacterium]
MSVSDAIGRLGRSPEDIRAENLRRWVTSIEDVTTIQEVHPRQRTRVAGVIQNIRIDPRNGRDAIEATIIDGTDRMVAKWLGRSSLLGIQLGMGLIMEGVPGAGPDGMLVMLNPDYVLVPGPEHG